MWKLFPHANIYSATVRPTTLNMKPQLTYFWDWRSSLASATKLQSNPKLDFPP